MKKVSNIVKSCIVAISCSALILTSYAAETFTFRSFKGTSACHSNSYFQDYGCSPGKIIALAQEGDADAEYAVGYLFYYGIGMVRNEQKSKKWMLKAAAQGQNEAKMALKMISKKYRMASRPKKHRQNHPRAIKSSRKVVSPVERSQREFDREFRIFWSKK